MAAAILGGINGIWEDWFMCALFTRMCLIAAIFAFPPQISLRDIARSPCPVYHWMVICYRSAFFLFVLTALM